MFLIFINDLPLVLKTAVTSTDLYADDTTAYDIQSNMQTLQKKPSKRTFFTEQMVQRKWYGDKYGQVKSNAHNK